MAGRFGDKIVWITGASAGLGRALALEFAQQGAHLALSARRVDRLSALVRDIERLGRRAVSIPCDVVDEAAVQSAADAVTAHFGRMDVAIANAGFGVAGRIERLDAAAWRRQFDTNVVGLAMTARHALPHLHKSAGRIVLIGSVAAFLPGPGSAPYSASKAAVRSIGESLAVELAGSSVTTTTIHPGYVESEIAQVDNEGRFDANAVDHRPAKLMWKSDRAARVMVRAIARRDREYVFTGHGKLGAFIGQHFPSLAQLAMQRAPRRRKPPVP